MVIKDRLAELWDSTDVLDSLWRVFGSPYATILLFLALAVVIGLAILLPQRPAEALADPAADSLWLASLRARYGGTADWLMRLRLCDLYRSLWLRGLLGLLAFNLMLGVVELYRPRYRPGLRLAPSPGAGVADRPEGEEAKPEAVRPRAGPLCTDIPMGVLAPSQSAELLLERVKERLRAEHYRLLGGAERRLVYADRFVLFPILVYLGLLLVLGGLLLSEHTAWWEENVAVRPGQIRPIGHGTGLALRADAIEADYDPATGRLRGGRTELTFLRAGGPVGRGILYDDSPSLYAGLMFYQMSTEPVLLMQAQDASGRSLALQTPESGATQFSEVTLRFREQVTSRFIVVLDLTAGSAAETAQGGQPGRQFEERGNEAYVLVPGRDLSLRLCYISPESGEGPAAFQVEAFRGAESSPFYQAQFSGAAALEIGGDRYLFNPQRHAVIKFGRDYAVVFVLLGAVMALVGSTLSVWRPLRRLWLATQLANGEVSLRLMKPGPVGPWFEALVQSLSTLSAVET